MGRVSPVVRIARSFAASRERVFHYWVDGVAIRTWFAPAGYVVISSRVDATPGGTWWVRYRSESDPDEVHEEFGTFQEVLAPRRLVFTLTRRDHRGLLGPQTLVTVELTDTALGTAMSFTQTGHDSDAAREANDAGWSSCFAQLEHELLGGKPPAALRRQQP